MSKKEEVIIYGAEWCGYCHQAMRYFDEKDVPYVYHDIEKDPEAAKELMQKIGGPVSGVPVLDVHGEIILGYDIGRINKALAKPVKA